MLSNKLHLFKQQRVAWRLGMYEDHRRSCPRNLYETRIVFSENIEGDYKVARMYNKSKNGMYIEVPQPLEFDTGVYVNLLQTDSPDSHCGYFARVKWCKKIEDAFDESKIYGIGVNYISKSRSLFGEMNCIVKFSCDACGKKVELRKLIKTNNFLYQCTDCKTKIENYPDGNLKSSIEDYLLGNIL